MKFRRFWHWSCEKLFKARILFNYKKQNNVWYEGIQIECKSPCCINKLWERIYDEWEALVFFFLLVTLCHWVTEWPNLRQNRHLIILLGFLKTQVQYRRKHSRPDLFFRIKSMTYPKNCWQNKKINYFTFDLWLLYFSLWISSWWFQSLIRYYFKNMNSRNISIFNLFLKDGSP